MTPADAAEPAKDRRTEERQGERLASLKEGVQEPKPIVPGPKTADIPRSSVTIDDVIEHEGVQAFIALADKHLGEIGYTEHGFRHAGLVSKIAYNVLHRLGFDELWSNDHFLPLAAGTDGLDAHQTAGQLALEDARACAKRLRAGVQLLARHRFQVLVHDTSLPSRGAAGSSAKTNCRV